MNGYKGEPQEAAPFSVSAYCGRSRMVYAIERSIFCLWLPAVLLAAPAAAAQDGNAEPSSSDRRGAAAKQGDAATPLQVQTASKRSYLPEEFARFAPRNALDMLKQVPGFAIQANDIDRRGLGQATGNVLINGERFSSKSTDLFGALQRISANRVIRIDVADGATFDVPGLAGQVADVILGPTAVSGNFVWRPQIRARRTPFRWSNGEVSINGAVGSTGYTLGFQNDSRRNGNAGLELVTDSAGSIIDRRDEVFSLKGDQPRLTASINHVFGDGSVLNLNAAGGLYYGGAREISARSGPNNPARERTVKERSHRRNYEIGGDFEFSLFRGTLKLFGLRRFEHNPFRQTVVEAFADGAPTTGGRFIQNADETETISRGEYHWGQSAGKWQLSFEAALNKLDIENELFERDPTGTFVRISLPNAAAIVEEKRADAALSYGRPLSPNLTIQVSIGAEYSRLGQAGAGGLTRIFYRPKGFLNVAWRPGPNLDLSARIERDVGQLDFRDFVASANVGGGTNNSGNVRLKPPQSWDGQLELNRGLGSWGTARIRAYGRLIRNVVDFVPIGQSGQSRGNLDGTAKMLGVQWTSSFNSDPMGWTGGKLDLNLQFQKTSLTDPLTGNRRPINENMVSSIEANFRQDIPGSEWAFGGSFSQFRQSAGFRLDQRFHYKESPGTLSLFVEHKNLFGLTGRGEISNLLGTNESFSTIYFDGRRNGDNSNRLFTEDRDRFYGPVFTLKISGAL